MGPGTSILFIHQGSINGRRHSILQMPLAMPALAAMLKKKGFSAYVINLSTQLIFNPEYDVLKLIKKLSPSFIGLPLQWHAQSKDTLALASKIKKYFPRIKIVSGGFSASFFHKEIMKSFSQIDFVIRGDAELPLLMLLKTGPYGNFSSIPNLSFRSISGKPVHNPLNYSASIRELDSLKLSDHSRILNPENAFLTSDNFSFELGKDSLLNLKEKFFYSPGRGCAWNCTFCAGCAENQLKTMGRRKPIYKSLYAAANDLASLVKNGRRKIHFAFDPLPNSRYYPRLFAILRRKKISFETEFESFGLPSLSFLREFALTFTRYLDKSSITISPETGSESLRRKTRGFFYSNKQLINFARQAAALGIRVSFCFSTGLPLEKKKDMRETLLLVKLLREISDKFEFSINRIALEPGSPIFMHPENFRIKLTAKSLKNFLSWENTAGSGYRNNSLSEKEICNQIKRFRQVTRTL